MKKKVLAVQLPAFCPLACAHCRTPHHKEGDAIKVFDFITENHFEYDEIYLTSNGETGYFQDFKKLVKFLRVYNKDVSVLCATLQSIVPGLKRVEISYYPERSEVAKAAIEKAKELCIPFTLSVVAGTISYYKFDTLLEQLKSLYGAEAVLVRQKQKEGRSKEVKGTTTLFQLTQNEIGVFPVAAYQELKEFDHADVTCVNEYGNIVPYLGDQKAVA